MPYPTKKLGEVTKIEGGGTPSTKNPLFWSGDVLWLTPKELSDFSDREIFDTKRKSTSEGLKHSKLFPAGTVLFTSRAPIGYVAIAGIQMATNQGFKNFICSEKVLNNGFLYYFIKLKTKYLQSLGRGATFTEISRSILAKVDIPLPPLEIQKQIVERLDKIVAAQNLNDDLIKKAVELFQSLLHKELNSAGPAYTPTKQHTNKLEYVGMSGSRSKTPADASAFVKTSEDKKAMAGKKDWEIKKLGFVYKRITDAILPTKHPEQKFNFIGLENIESNTSRLINLIPVEGKFIKSTKTRFKSGDVLYGKLRPYLNKVWLADFDGICSTDIWVLRAKEGIILPQLLGAILQQSSIVQKSSASMAGANLPRANKDIFDKIAIALPPLEIQKQIVAKLSAVQSYRSGLTEQKMKLKELFDSVLHRSMSSPR